MNSFNKIAVKSDNIFDQGPEPPSGLCHGVPVFFKYGSVVAMSSLKESKRASTYFR
jgi:hypothetical protein